MIYQPLPDSFVFTAGENRDKSGFIAKALNWIRNKKRKLLLPGNSLEEVFALVERAKEEWESTVDTLPELICVVDENGRILRANRTIETWQLAFVEEVKGLKFHTLVHPTCKNPDCYLEAIFQKTLGEGSLQEALTIFDTVLQRYLQVTVRTIPAHSKATEPRYVLIMNDISQDAAIEAQIQAYTLRLKDMKALSSAILAAESPMEIAQVALSRLNQLVQFHQARLLIYHAQSKKFHALTADAQGNIALQKHMPLSEALNSGCNERYPEKFFYVKDITAVKNLSTAELELTAAGAKSYVNFPLVAESDFLGCLCLTSDEVNFFTDAQIETAQEVANLLAISTYQATLNSQLQNANNDLRQLVRERFEVMQDVTHELRSPLALIKGFVEILIDETLGPLTPKQIEALQIVGSKGDDLHRLVNRLLTIQTINRETLRRERINVYVLLQDMRVSWLDQIGRHQLQLKLDLATDLPDIYGDVTLLNQVLANLLDNAIKFSPENSTITLSAYQQEEQLIISVRDEGAGIEPTIIEQIFRRFYQGERRSSFGSSAGIGLSLCKAVVEAHNGRIWAESAGLGQGSTFYFSVPLTAQDE